LISADVVLVAFATIAAIAVRGRFGTVQTTFLTFAPYVLISVASAALVFFAGGLDRTPWRHSTVADHLQIAVLTVLVVLLALLLTFVVNRLEGIARSVPVLQGALVVSILGTARGAARFWFIRQIHAKATGDRSPREAVLVVGVNTISELFLLSAQEFASRQIQVAGIVSEEPTTRGRTIQQNPILGSIGELPEILQSLEVHGIFVNRIVVAIAAYRLSPRALQILLEVEQSSEIVVQFLSERLGLEQSSTLSERECSTVHGQSEPTLVAVNRYEHGLNGPSERKTFRVLKRTIDTFGAIFLFLMLSPMVMLVAVIVAMDVGFPVLFWQQRPGLNGRPFRLYKFRTMGASHDKHSNRIPDEQRLSAVGRTLRRSRLDELPQLFNVLRGDMSFVGPRPLLPHDQSAEYAARLSVRPGITGWAQINGGRVISPSEKCILDIWYVKNASLTLDFVIVLRTFEMLLFGERINKKAVFRAQSDYAKWDPQLRPGMTPAE
jgi:lipopolysaccharide/colanic/teichoic acid biosynthesis glycosyltransferase